MKKLLLIIPSLILLAGCGQYGTGSAQGYIYTQDEGRIYDHIWFKPSLDSTESDCYSLKDKDLKEQLSELSSDTKVKITYDRNTMIASMCGSDVITDFEVIN